jgi:hypothetical protein
VALATRTERTMDPRTFRPLHEEPERTGPRPPLIPPGGGVRANGSPSFPQPQIVGVEAGPTAGGEHRFALDDVGGARLFVSDVRMALLLLDEARYRAVKRLVGGSRAQSWPVTLIALAVLASAAHTKSEQMLRGPALRPGPIWRSEPPG